MNLLILGTTTAAESPSYRGTLRAHPYHVDRLPDSHPVNQAFFWYCEEGGELGAVHNLARARDLVHLYAALWPPQRFEIIEVTAERAEPMVGSSFLGFDISSGFGDSLLASGLELVRLPLLDTFSPERKTFLLPLLEVVQRFFQPKLNELGLFPRFEDAEFYLHCLRSIGRVEPGLFEEQAIIYKIIGVWKVE